MNLFPGSLSSSSRSTSSRSQPQTINQSPRLQHAQHIENRTPTPMFSPPPPDHDFARRVHWGSPEIFSAPSLHPTTTISGSEAAETEEEQDDEKAAGGTVLAITAMKGRVGCCYLSPAPQGDGKLYFLEDTRDEAWDLVELVVAQITPSPSLVLTSSSADPAFLTTLEKCLAELPSSSSNASSSTAEAETEGINLEYRPMREFYAGPGRGALCQLLEGMVAVDQSQAESPRNEDEDAGEGEPRERQRDAYDFQRRRRGGEGGGGLQHDQQRRAQELRLEAFVNGLEGCALTLGCAGALLAHFKRQNSALGELGDGDGGDGLGEMVKGIELMHLDKVLLINQEALASLQIFSPESHASMHSSSTKEGLSLFGILNLTRTPLGFSLLRQWFLRPSRELDVIDARHNAVECFLRSENQHIADAVQSHFRSVKNVRKKLGMLENGKGGLADWQTVWQFLYAAIMVRDCCLSLAHRGQIEVVDQFLAAFDADKFRALGSMINDVIDWEESALLKRVAVKPGVDEELDELRRTYHGLSSLLSRVATDLSTEVPPDFAESLSVIYFPQLGYLINVPYKEGVTDPEVCEQIGWEFQFVTEEYAYFKSDKCRDLDRHLGDLHSFISDKEIEILHSLLSHTLEAEPEIIATCSCLAELDCLLAFAEASRLYKWNRPVMTEQPVCKIRGGRHPLVELCVDAFVPNDAALVGGRGLGWDDDEEDDDESDTQQKESGFLDPNQSMIIVTGANYSGKSIFLKQIALLNYMAHLGCFIPADRALIGLTDRILTRVSTRESITRGSSAFMIDLQQISFALRNATARSLVIIDEFGKGTESDDGAGLFCAVMEHFIGRGGYTPRVAAATHFHNIFANGILSKELPIGLAHMVIQFSDSTGSSVSTASADSTLTYLYRLAPSISLTSHAAACAALFGIAPSILSRANEISTALMKFDLDSILNAALTNDEQKELQAGEQVARRLLEWDMDGDEWMHEEVGAEAVKAKLSWVLGLVGEDEEMDCEE